MARGAGPVTDGISETRLGRNPGGSQARIEMSMRIVQQGPAQTSGSVEGGR